MLCLPTYRRGVQGATVGCLGLLLGWAPFFVSGAAAQEETLPLYQVVAQGMLECLAVQGHTAELAAGPTSTRIIVDGVWAMSLDSGPRNSFQHDAGLELWLDHEAAGATVEVPLVPWWVQPLFEYPAAVHDIDEACLRAAYATVVG